MANLSRKDDTDVFVSDVVALDVEGGKLSSTQVATLTGAVREHSIKLNGLVSHGTGASGHRGNIDECFWDVVTPAAANTEFIVPHTLGRLPTAVKIVRADRAAIIYDSSAGSWTETILYLKCNVASAQLKLEIY